MTGVQTCALPICIVVGGVEEAFERPDAGALFLEKLDDCFSFSLIGSGGVQQ